MEIKKEYIPKGRKNRPGYAMKPSYITIHNTGNSSKGANAEMHGRYVKNPTTAESWHYTVDDQGIIYQHLPTTENGWHAGDGTNGVGNRRSIGIEICDYEGIDENKANANAIWLVNKLMKEHGISIGNVVPHKNWSGKNCPRKLLPIWSEFITNIKNKQEVQGEEKNPSVFKVLKYGDRGPEVYAMQQALAQKYFYPEKGAPNHGVDGLFGLKTQNAVRRFQMVYTPREVDGIYGPKTRAALEKL